VINGTTVPIDLAKIRITWTEKSAEELRPIVEASPKGRTFATPVDWRIADRGKNVTDNFITEPPGRPRTGPADARPPPPPRRAAPYIEPKLIAAIKAKDGASQFDCTKLLQLIDELNHNYARENVYSTHALLRARESPVPIADRVATNVNLAAPADGKSIAGHPHMSGSGDRTAVRAWVNTPTA
jgi:hypothetical protein